MHKPSLSIVFLLALWTTATAAEELKPGLIATYRDDAKSVWEVTLVPELGLTAEESPHTAIKPAFTASYAGFLQVTQLGRYQFDTLGTLTSINRIHC